MASKQPLTDLPLLLSYLLITVGVLPSVRGQSNPMTDTLPYYVVQDDYPIQSLFTGTSILIDQDKEWTIEDILTARETTPFQPLADNQTLWTSDRHLWLRIRLLPKTDLNNWWLVHKLEGDLGWIMDTYVSHYQTYHNEERVYFVQQGKVVHQAATGTYIPASQKDTTADISVNRVKVSLQKNVPTDIYFQIRDFDWISTLVELRAPHIPLLAIRTPMARSMNTMSSFSFIISIYVLCFFFFTRDRSYLYLFGMLLCLFLHYNILHPEIPLISVLVPEYPQLREPLWAITTMGSYIFFLQFGRTFANLKVVFPPGNRLVLWCIRIALGLLLLRLILWMIHPTWEATIMLSSAMITMLLSLLVVIRLAFIKDSLVRLFVYGGSWLFFFAIWGILWETNMLSFFDYPSPWVVSQAGFMLIAALSLAHKIQLSERARSEVEKIRAIDSVKSKFFANISHEFRTPLTLILGPVNQALEAIPASDAVEDQLEIPVKGKQLKVMKRNAQRLQNLVDQILDLSKLDQGQLQLQVAPGDIVQFIRSIVFSFESLAERKHIHFRTHFPRSIEGAYFDRDKLEKILVNLLSNAFKFTPEHGEVAVRMEDTGKTLKITISDTGNGMKAEESARVFDRFYQVEGTQDQGTGIGLSLVKELVDLHNGQIGVDSIEGGGTTFKLSLPYHISEFKQHRTIDAPLDMESSAFSGLNSDPDEPQINTATDSSLAKEQPLILIVEDNPDLRHYIAEQLAGGFNIITAQDGKRGLQLAESKLPDLIISDVMMPGMTGLQLCEALKQDVKTSHIPIILLTARAGTEAKIEGLQTGADDYLTKPFNGRELITRVRNLIEQRARLQEKFAGELHMRPTAMKLSSMDEQFLTQVMEVIEKNMDNEYFSVEDLASAVGFSRSQLHRKLKGLSGKSPNQLIREFRMTRAKELLEQRAASVSEIAYRVGYSNLSYFSRSFKDAFGISPSEVPATREASVTNSKNPENL